MTQYTMKNSTASRISAAPRDVCSIPFRRDGPRSTALPSWYRFWLRSGTILVFL
jgi:hypothetical protein